MVHNDMPTQEVAEAPKAEAPAKEEKKSSYMDEVKKLYASYGNPSGGMVHNDMPAKNEAASKKEGVKEAKTSSYMKQVGLLAAVFANPSGGFVHNDMQKETSKVADALMPKKADANKVVAAALAARRGR